MCLEQRSRLSAKEKVVKAFYFSFLNINAGITNSFWDQFGGGKVLIENINKYIKVGHVLQNTDLQNTSDLLRREQV